LKVGALTIQPRGLRREQAADYLGISPSKFDNERRVGRIPPPNPLLPGVIVWDRYDLDALFDGSAPIVAANDNNEWDSVHETA
jgi:predicted DNA-binding transcriptional regulator AlpA